MLDALSFSFTRVAQDSTVIPSNEKQQVATPLERDAEVTSNTTQLDVRITGQRAEVEAAVLAVNTHARAETAPSKSAS